MSTEEKNIGSPDRPEDEDALGLATYIDGMAEFIKECPTPMTISIQGDWGAGKSTLFNLISKKINEKQGEMKEQEEENSKEKTLEEKRIDDFLNSDYPVIRINTWQFAVAGYKDNLTLVLLSIIYKSLIEVLLNQNLLKGEEAEKLGSAILKFAAFACAEGLAGEKTVGALECLLNRKDKKFTKEKLNTYADTIGITHVEEICNEIQKAIKLVVGALDKKKIIIFIDDLDRLEPRNAVELLEGVKNFMDYDHCVYVLALDQKVVFQGVNDKYGEQMGKDIGEKFFDKIIQVPFTLPVVSYNVGDYIQTLKKDEKIEIIENYKYIVDMLTDKNPRALKRLFNMHTLHEKFEFRGNNKDLDEDEKVILLSILAFQMKDGKRLNELIKSIDKVNKTKILQENIDDIKMKLEKDEYAELGGVIRYLFGEDEKKYNEASQKLLKLLKGTVGAVNASSGPQIIIPQAVENNLKQFRELLKGDNGVTEEEEARKNGPIYYYHMGKTERKKYATIAVYENYFNVTLYEEGIPKIRENIMADKYMTGISKKDDAKESDKIYYYNNGPKDQSSICIANIYDERVSSSLLEDLYNNHIKPKN